MIALALRMTLFLALVSCQIHRGLLEVQEAPLAAFTTAPAAATPASLPMPGADALPPNLCNICSSQRCNNVLKQKIVASVS